MESALHLRRHHHGQRGQRQPGAGRDLCAAGDQVLLHRLIPCGDTCTCAAPDACGWGQARKRGASVRQGDAVTYLHTDHLGTVSIATNQSQVVLARTLNLPYGGVRWTSGTMPTDWGYTGQKEPIGTGLVYLHARFYAPATGRFLSADTIVQNWSDPQHLNRYTYVRNNPTNLTDPTGHLCVGPVLFLCLIAIGGGSFFAVDYFQQSTENYNKGLSGGQEFFYKNIDWQRSGAATVNGAVTGALTYFFPTRAIATRLGGGVGAWVTAGSLSGATSSAGGKIAENFTTNLVKDKKVDLLEGVPEAAAAGGVIGGVFEGASLLIRHTLNNVARASQALARTQRQTWLVWEPEGFSPLYRVQPPIPKPLLKEGFLKGIQLWLQALNLPWPKPPYPVVNPAKTEPQETEP